jgi:succinate dehydrogenase / fumarate reductase flavoprotein subunit/fumarate reductase flavoprotein subunit
MDVLRSRAEAAGVAILDRISIVDLLTSDGRSPTCGVVVGAVGFHVRDGTFAVIRAKQVVLATGLLAIKGFHPVDNDTGDGFAMAYRVGASFLDAEFAAGGTFEFVWGRYFMGGFNLAIGHGARLVNGLGERFMERYDPDRLERTEINRVVAAFIRELRAGRGPVSLDLTGVSDAFWDAVQRAKAGRRSVLVSGPIPDPRQHWVPIEPAWTLWNGGKGGVHTDLWCRTNVPGLFAAGAVARNSAVGRHGSAGTPTAHAMVTGVRSGAIAAEQAAAMPLPDIDEEQVRSLMRRTFDPLDRVAGGSADPMHEAIQHLLGSTIDVMVQSDTSIRRSLAQVAELRTAWTGSRVRDHHELVKYHEATNLLDSLEFVYRAMLDRTESRETFYREDYPMTDDLEWLCWHTARLTDAGVVFTRDEIPFSRYRYRPPSPQRTLSPIAAILQGQYEPVAGA